MRVSAFYDANGQLDLLTRHIGFSGTLSSPVSGNQYLIQGTPLSP